MNVSERGIAFAQKTFVVSAMGNIKSANFDKCKLNGFGGDWQRWRYPWAFIQAGAKPRHPVVVQVIDLHMGIWSTHEQIGTVSGKRPWLKVYIWNGTIEQAKSLVAEGPKDMGRGKNTLRGDVDETPLAPGVYQGWVNEDPLRTPRSKLKPH